MTTTENRRIVDRVVEAPTYMADIRFFFRPEDVEHMAVKGYELGTYEGVKRDATRILAATAPPEAPMPPDPAGKWSPERSQTFKKWILNGFPLGTATPPEPSPNGAPPARLRRNVTTLSDAEFDLLKTAFDGLMARDPEAPDSYFALAGQHGLPKRWCMHHENRYNPWHRQYLRDFEDALRSVPGCAEVTIPYWDISTDLPDRLQHPPFDKYVLPADPGATATPNPVPGFFPYTTERFPVAEIAQNVREFGVLDDIATSLTQSLWGAFNVNGYQDFSIQAHDGGHGSIGPTMGDQDVASFDPVFWFFHCNLDRLWLSWQTRVSATTLNGFRTTVGPDTDWLTTPPLNELIGFSVTADQTIETDVSYDQLELVSPVEGALENLSGSIEAVRSFAFRSASPVSVRVKGIDRLNIPGSFIVSLLADGELVAKRYFFQPDAPRGCATCVQNGIVNIDFRMTQEQLLDRTLSVRIDVPKQAEEFGTGFPLAQAGNPTINARLLVEDA
ncbi:tyrosinase family protein [Streptomyces sp. BE147]|uniref:tyrosinase family protein n=1 Tax=Streptomyces sp. BE147 TaxID=3002524 RepID=UPI002E768191|nr:tyrosinase family protein [Streptomyces sp. BE147]MEE1742759.1 tyrosinase family protein [Streptomyces sp. BE147]